VLEQVSWRAAAAKLNIDIHSQYLAAYSTSETLFFFLAVIISALTIVSAVYLRPQTKGVTP
jgi:hypothetical protein